MVYHPSLLTNEVAVVEDREVGDTSHIVSGSELGMAFRVDLEYQCLSRHVGSRARDFGSRHTAWAAPGCPEVHQEGNTRFAQNFVEKLNVGFERLICRWQWRFAGSATSGIREMRGRNAILA